jgi:hypothetical protein
MQGDAAKRTKGVPMATRNSIALPAALHVHLSLLTAPASLRFAGEPAKYTKRTDDYAKNRPVLLLPNSKIIGETCAKEELGFSPVKVYTDCLQVNDHLKRSSSNPGSSKPSRQLATLMGFLANSTEW